MIDFEEIKNYLPKYLSSEATEKLFNELEAFPNNIDKRFYSGVLYEEKIIFQGDGIRDLPVINLPDPAIEQFPVIVISNTCDISPENKRLFEPKILYCPLIRLSKYEALLQSKGIKEERIRQNLNEIREQKISSIFYLPQGEELPEDCIALLDGINNCNNSIIEEEDILGRRLFSLSNYGFYLFLFKLSIHFTRIREAVER